MSEIKLVLCPVDFTDLAREELKLAVEVCETFGARLVLFHNLSSVSPGLTRAWEWQEVHQAQRGSAAKADAHIKELLASLPKTFPAEATVTSGPVATLLLGLAQELPADLVILGSHGWSTEDHTSVAERIIERCPCPVLTIHDGVHVDHFKLRATGTDALTDVVVPTDFSPSATAAVAYAFALARTTTLRVHIVHVLPHGQGFMELDAAKTKLKELVPADVADRADCHVLQGNPIDELITGSSKLNASLIIMGEHARGFFRRLFTKDTARELLHRAPCPVLFVPPK